MKKIAIVAGLLVLLLATTALAQPVTPGAQAKIDFTLTGDNTVIAAAAGRSIKVYSIWIVVSANTNLTFKDGTGTALTGVVSMLADGSITLDPVTMPWFVTTPGNAFVINQSGTAQISGRVYYNVGP